ncbi:10593_t:CDS:10 [Scutellospora calospora]|uniref:10593_t:CDS:1 n=1 Tax=Scutellospora calospora TaxID=85575 RepID=A0ACA9L0Y9_9GLOM|nr:10593_t:CDS:10 [Scutellospora calospora]
MSLSSEAKKRLRLTDLNYKLGHKEYTFYKYWLASRFEGATLKGHGHTDKNDTALLDAYRPEEIHSQYIIQIAGKGYTTIDHPSEVYRIPDTHECIDRNQPLCLIIDIDARQKPDPTNSKLFSLDGQKITREDLLSRILVACADALSLILEYMLFLNSFALASLSNTEKYSWYIIYPRAQFVDYRELKGFTEKVIELVEEPYAKFINIGLPKSRFSLQLLGSAKEGRIKRPAISSVNKGFKNLDDYLVQPKENYFVIWLRTFSDERLAEEEYQPIDDNNALVKLEESRRDLSTFKHNPLKNALYMMLNMKKINSIDLFDKIAKAVSNPHLLLELSEEVINIKEIEDFPEAYPNFLSKEPSTTLIRSPIIIGKTKVQVKSLSHIEFSARSIVAILDEVNAIQHQMNSTMDAFANESTLTLLKAYHSENIRIIDNKFQLLIGKTVEYLYNSNSRAKAMQIGFEYLKHGKRVAFVVTSSNMAQALVKEASKLSFKAHINTAWGELNCVAYTNTVEADISFEKSNHFDIVIGITNIGTPVNIEAFIQMIFRIHDCEKHILSLYYQKISSEFSRSPGHENIRAELADINSISYKLDQSPAITSFVEVEHQKHLSTRNFIKISCSLIASTGVSLKLIKMDENKEIIGNCKNVRNEIKEAEFLKLNSECSVADTIVLNLLEPRKHFLHLSHFYKQGYDEESVVEELKAKDIVQWEDTCYNAKDNFEDSVAKDLYKTYSANHWEAIRGLLQLLGFTGIDDKRILSNNQVKVTFEASHKKFIEIRSQALLLFGFRSHTKEIPDLKLAIKAINAISYNGRGFNNQEEVIARKLDNPEYCPIAPVFHHISRSGMIDEKGLSLEMPAHNQSSGLS